VDDAELDEEALEIEEAFDMNEDAVSDDGRKIPLCIPLTPLLLVDD
jgi:hypothetical protein